jgi:hypothetical protein
MFEAIPFDLSQYVCGELEVSHPCALANNPVRSEQPSMVAPITSPFSSQSANDANINMSHRSAGGV